LSSWLSMARAFDRRGMTVLSLGHMCADMCQGAIPALLPFLIADRDYSYSAVSALILGSTIASSIIQPVFGAIADRRSMPWLLPGGIVLGGAGVALVGVMPSYPLTFLAVVISGLGVAAFHPEAARGANHLAGHKRATGMSVFSVGGNAGFAVGPLLVTPLVLAFGLPGTLAMILPPAAIALVLAREAGRMRESRAAGLAAHAAGGHGDDAWGPFGRLGVVIAARSILYFGLMTFVPLYFVDHLGTGEAEGNAALTVMLAGGAAGTLIGGPLADRLGRRVVLCGTVTLIAPMIGVFLADGPALATLAAGFIGAATIATFSLTVVMGQEYLPNRLGFASGITIGLAIGVGGLGAAVLGPFADAHGPRAAILVLLALPAIMLALGLTLPDRHRRPEPDPALRRVPVA
jgi:FSR family fosmidomycin resistance protein-like MFS transporter